MLKAKAVRYFQTDKFSSTVAVEISNRCGGILIFPSGADEVFICKPTYSLRPPERVEEIGSLSISPELEQLAGTAIEVLDQLEKSIGSTWDEAAKLNGLRFISGADR